MKKPDAWQRPITLGQLGLSPMCKPQGAADADALGIAQRAI